MKHILFSLILLLLPSFLFADGYSIFIDRFDYKKQNEAKISHVLQDVAYPSIKTQNNQIYIYSGRFKDFTSANKLLQMTKLRYKNAAVASSNGTKRYYGTPLFSPVKSENVPQHSNLLYCVKVYEETISKSNRDKTKINYILNKLPDTSTEQKGDKFIIYSGKFKDQHVANTIAKLLQKDFRRAEATVCQNQKNSMSTKYPRRVMGTKYRHNEEPIYEKKFDILMLDDNGYIHKDIRSSKRLMYKEIVKKSNLSNGLIEEKATPLDSFYLRTNIAYDTKNTDSAYDIRVEFDIFQQGYHENKEKVQKINLKNKIALYKTLKNIEVLQKAQEYLKIKKYKNSIIQSGLALRLQVAKEHRDNAKEKYDKGILIQYEYDKYKLSLQNIDDELILYESMNLAKIPYDLWMLLNKIEEVHLISDYKLLTFFEENTIDAQLSQAIQEEKLLTEGSWRDKLRVNVYTGIKKQYVSQDQSLIGVEAKIPFSIFVNDREIQTLQNQTELEQTELAHSQARELLQDEVADFKYRQQRLKTSIRELARLKQRIIDLKMIDSSAFSVYANIDFATRQNSIDKYLQQYEDIQKERLNAYKVLVNIMHLERIKNVQELFEYPVDPTQPRY